MSLQGRVDGPSSDIVYCTGPGGIWVLDPTGRHIGTIVTSLEGALMNAINLAWRGDEGDRLFITASTALLSISKRACGIPAGCAKSSR